MGDPRPVSTGMDTYEEIDKATTIIGPDSIELSTLQPIQANGTAIKASIEAIDDEVVVPAQAVAPKGRSTFMASLLPDSLKNEAMQGYALPCLSPEDAKFEKQFTDHLGLTKSDEPADEKADDRCVGSMRRSLATCWKEKGKVVSTVIGIIFLLGYTVYLGFAIAYSVQDATALIVITGLVVLWYIYAFFRDRWGQPIYERFLKPLGDWWDRNWHVIKWFLVPILIIAMVLYLTLVVVHEVRQLQSISGFVIFFFFLLFTSKHPDKIIWRPVIWGYTLQFILGALVLQWKPGYDAVKWLADLITKIINYGYEGAAVVYGDPMMILHPYVMMGMSLLIYVGSLMSILYYLGVTQVVARKMAWLMQVSMKTTAIETLGVASNVFLNGLDVMMMLRGYLDKLTLSEFNCFAVGNCATIAGFIFGILILFGAPPQHLVSGAVMSAPATIAISKLNWPETRPDLSKTSNMETIQLTKGEETNMFEAAANGSAVAGKTAFTVVVNYISFLGILGLLDAFLAWIGEMVGFYGLSFEWICSYLFWPIALVIGIEVNQCREVAKLIGIKVFTTEIYAYQMLGQSYNQGRIDERSRAITTYALCGFCSLSTLAIAVGVWDAVCPQRRRHLANIFARILMQANIACFTTACIAGLFFSEQLAIFETVSDPPIKALVQWIWALVPKISDIIAA